MGRRLVSASICEEFNPNKDSRPQRQLDQMEDKKIMLNRFLGDTNSAVHSKPRMLEDEGSLPESKHGDDAASIKSASDGELDTIMPTDEKLESLEETVRSFMSGRPIELYQKKLQQWLDLFTQPSQGDVEPVDPIENTNEEASEHSQRVANAIFRYKQNRVSSRNSEPTVPTVKADALLTISQKGISELARDQLKWV